MSVNLGTATGYLDLDLSKFKQGMAEAGKQAQELPKQIKGSMGSVGETFREIGGTIADFGEGMTKMITLPVVAAISASIKQFANFEQAVGGVETMFKDNASSVISNSETAYKRAGVSGVEYMEQLTSFSASLLQGLGGDTEKASKIADMAMVDMSDNANKFGTDIGSVQDAYQGFAKQNYTMLDNLKLGYGGTASEMARLINDSGVMGDSFVATAKNMDEVPFDKMIEGIHQIQDGMGVTGTTLLEAEETISGSFGMMKASLMDFLAGMGSADADIGQLIQNMIDSFGFLKENIVRVLKQIWDNLPLSNFQKWAGLIVTAAGPILLVFGKIMTGVGSLIGTFVTAEGALTPFGAMMKGLVSGPFLAVVAGIAILVAAFMDLWKNNEDFRNKIQEIWSGIQEKFAGFFDGIKERLNDLGITFESFGDLLKAVWDKITEFLAPIFIFAFETLETVISVALDTILNLFDFFVAIFNGDWESAWESIKNIVSDVLKGLESVIANGLDIIGKIFTDIWSSMYTFFSEFLTNILGDTDSTFGGIVSSIQNSMKTIWEVITNVLEFIKITFSNAIGFITALLNGDWAVAGDFLIQQWEAVKAMFGIIWDAIKQIFSNTWDIIKIVLAAAWDWIKAKLSEVWDGIKDYFSELWQGIKDKTSEIWEGIKQYFSETWESIKTKMSDAWESMKSSTSETWDGIKQFFIDIWELIKTTFINGITAIITYFIELPENFVKGLIVIWEFVSTWAIDMWNKATELGETFVTNLMIFFDELPEKIGFAIGFAIGTIIQFGIDMWDQAVLIGTNFVTTIVTFFSELPGKIADFTSMVWENIKTWATDMWNKAKETGTKFVDNIVSFFTTLPGVISGLITEVWNNIKTWATNMWDKAKEVGTKFLDNIITFFTQLPGKIKGFTDKVWNDITTWATNVWNKATEMGTKFVNNIVNFFTQLPGKISAFTTQIWNNITTWATNMWNKASEMGRNVVNNVVTTLQSLPGKVKAKFNEVITAAKTWVTDMGTKGKEAITTLWNKFSAAFRGIKTKIKKIGGDIVSGVWEGITGAAKKFTDNVKNFFGGIVSGAKSALGIKSPSSVMADEIGEPMAEGAEVGFLGMFGQVVNSIQKTINDGVDGLTTPTVELDVMDDTDEFAHTIDNSATGMFEGILNIFETIETKITNSIDRTISELEGLTRQVNGGISYSLAYQAVASSGTSIPITQVTSKTQAQVKDQFDRKELIDVVKGLKDEIAKIKDLQIETAVYLDNKEIARSQRDPIDEELGTKSRDKNLAKGRIN